jgi:multiple sugar transport system substrate-binding protein
MEPQKKNSNILTVSLLIFSAEQRNAFEEIAIEFQNKYPEIEVKYISVNDKNYKKNSQFWLEESENIDILHWPWASQLRKNANQALIEPLTDLWQEPQISKNFNSAMKTLVTVGQHQYGIPYSSAVWGLYYRKSLFEKFNITPPTTWSEFLHACKKLKDNNIIPIAIGTINDWPTGGWFDYLNLRINGLSFHQQVVAGEVPFTSKKIHKVFKHWKTLIDQHFFIDNAQMLTFKQVLPLLYRNKAGMILSGSFLNTQISPQLRDDFGFLRFPTINPEVTLSEEVPTDIFILSKRSNNKQLAKQFLRFISQPEIIDILNKSIHFITPHKNANNRGDYFIGEGIKIMNDASGYSQYIDRDGDINFSKKAMGVFTKFIESGNINQTVISLEKIRMKMHEKSG